jgi:hypothetical protein
MGIGPSKLSDLYDTLQDLSVANRKIAVEAENFYTKKMAGCRAQTYKHAAAVLKEKLVHPNRCHSDRSVGSVIGP